MRLRRAEFIRGQIVWVAARSRLKKQPGEGTGPTMHADLQGNLVGRVPPRGEPAVFRQVARPVEKRPRQRKRSGMPPESAGHPALARTDFDGHSVRGPIRHPAGINEKSFARHTGLFERQRGE